MKSYKTKKPMELVLISDVHIGSETYNEEFFDYAIDYIKKGKNRRWAYLGDGIENNLRNSPGNVLFQKMSPDEQVDEWIHKIKPIKQKNIIYNGYSNHLARTEKEAGISLEKYIAAKLNLQITKPIDFLDLTVGEDNYLITHNHGASGGTTPAGRINAQKRFVDANEGDIFLLGHLHMAEIRWLYKRTKNNTFKPTLQCTNGSFLDYAGSYGDIKNYQPSPAHFVSICFNMNRNVQTKIHYNVRDIEW